MSSERTFTEESVAELSKAPNDSMPCVRQLPSATSLGSKSNQFDKSCRAAESFGVPRTYNSYFDDMRDVIGCQWHNGHEPCAPVTHQRNLGVKSLQLEELHADSPHFHRAWGVARL